MRAGNWGILVVVVAGGMLLAPGRRGAAGDELDEKLAEIKLEPRLKWRLEQEPAFRDVKVDVQWSKVVLEGKVATPADRQRAVDLALLAGAREVDNRIEVDPKWPGRLCRIRAEPSSSTPPSLTRPTRGAHMATRGDGTGRRW